MNKSLKLIMLALLIQCKLFAVIKLPAVISDNMVLQQKQKITLWGWADNGEHITVTESWSGKKVSTIAKENGKWEVQLLTGEAGGPYTITIKGSNEIVIRNVMLGEVWLCSGQSNMTFPIAKQTSWKTGIINAEEVIAGSDFPKLRMFITEQLVANTPQDDTKGRWVVCSPQTVGNFSAVAYYFGRNLMQKTGFPIGLIHSSWGGTPAESWVSKDVLASTEKLKQLLDKYDKNVEEYPASLIKYNQQLGVWSKDSVNMPASEKQKTRPKKPANPETDPHSSTKLYNAMIYPLEPYKLKGIIWYQGESNSDRAEEYKVLFPALIYSWRRDWKDSLPFYFVQIAPHGSKQPEIREAQLLTFRTVANTGMAVITDSGDSTDIHPRNKDVVGDRLARWALTKQYGVKDLTYSGPVYRSMKIEGNKIRLFFDYAETGLIAKEGDLKDFTITGSDLKFVPANARIDGQTVIVWSDNITNPTAVRFEWKNFFVTNFYNGAGLPASPFRTDGQ